MLQAFGTPHGRRRTFLLLAVSVALAIAAIIVGIDDNPPGIALGLLSATAFVVALVHTWSDSRRFRRLIYASVLGFVALVVISNLLEATVPEAAVPGAVNTVLNAAAIVAFMLCPAGLLVGVAGALITWRRERRSSSDPPAA